jgi:cell wall-associated NlpC family hydrolase
VRRISPDDVQPGDILFYFNNAHHVAMYIGGGQIVEASSPRTGVRVTDVWNSWSASHFSFAGRPLG